MKRVKSWDECVQIAPDWFAEFKPREPAANQTLLPLKGGGIALKWQAAPKRVRLSQHLNADLITNKGEPADYEVVLTFSSSFPSARDVITWVAILEESSKGEVRFHAKFRRSITKRDGKYVFSGRVESVRLTQSKKYTLCVQLGVSPKELVIHSVEGTAKSSNDNLARPATTQVADSVRGKSAQSNNKGALPDEGSLGILTRAFGRLRAILNRSDRRPSTTYDDNPYDPFD